MFRLLLLLCLLAACFVCDFRVSLCVFVFHNKFAVAANAPVYILSHMS